MKLNSHLVLIRVDDIKQQDENGIFMQEEWQSREPKGTVEAVAEDVKFCKVGDRVLFERFTSIPVPDADNLRMCREDAVLGVYDA